MSGDTEGEHTRVSPISDYFCFSQTKDPKTDGDDNMWNDNLPQNVITKFQKMGSHSKTVSQVVKTKDKDVYEEIKNGINRYNTECTNFFHQVMMIQYTLKQQIKINGKVGCSQMKCGKLNIASKKYFVAATIQQCYLKATF